MVFQRVWWTVHWATHFTLEMMTSGLYSTIYYVLCYINLIMEFQVCSVLPSELYTSQIEKPFALCIKERPIGIFDTFILTNFKWRTHNDMVIVLHPICPSVLVLHENIVISHKPLKWLLSVRFK